MDSRTVMFKHNDNHFVPKPMTMTSAEISKLKMPKNIQSPKDSGIESCVITSLSSSRDDDYDLIVENELRMIYESSLKHNGDDQLKSREKLFNVKVMNEKDADSVVKVMNHLRDSIIQFYIKKIHVHSMESSEFNDLASQLSMITSKLLHHSLSESNGTVNQNESKETNIIRNETVDAKCDNYTNDRMIKYDSFYFENELNETFRNFRIIWGDFYSEGPDHRPIWKITLKIDDRFFIGIGKTKKIAKINAAEIALKELENDPVFELNETFKDFPLIWGEFRREGPDHRLIWKITLKIDDRVFVGIGNTKKNAKINAAKISLKELENDPVFELNDMFRDIPKIWGQFKSEGPHHRLIWKISLKINDRTFIGVGNSKKSAKINAAEMALKEFKNVYTE